MVHRIGYLSGAPRVSTAENADASGPRAHVLGVIEGFERLGWQVERFIIGDRMSREMHRAGRGFVKGRSVVVRAAGDLGKMFLGRSSARRALQELNGKVDWVYERFAAFQQLGLPFKRRGIPWILETQGPMFYEATVERRVMALSRIARRSELTAYRSCDVLVCVSEALKKIFAGYGIDERRMIVVPNGVDAVFFDPARHAPARCRSAFTIGFVGSLDEWQALDALMDAVAELVHADRLDICVTIVGSGVMRDRWIQHAHRLGIESRVEFLGQRPRGDIPALIRGFDAGFSGQRRMKIGCMYHSPLKLLEYMAMEVPVVVSDVADPVGLVRHGENGFVFSHERAGSLADAIRTAVAVRNGLPAMGRRARQIVLADHTWDARVRYMTKCIDDLLPQVQRSG